ncbi:LysM peptidoglycan-binding domain-containing protein [Lactobacillus crispatus]|uniref:LysM peptidoglycan-binding domain-containing protein n=1 Tax=Lactobacillus crispatus TaxID=47770 RepID=UPI001F090679|nr:LysM peptidoglycan-binding domain-containing protein [Lactobacillus crispatus]
MTDNKPLFGINSEKVTVDAPKTTKDAPEVAVNHEKTALNAQSTPKKEVKRVAKNGFNYTNCKTYTVKEGQTLLDVANEVLVAYQQLRYFNGLSKTNPVVKAGQVIYIPDQAINVPLGK